MLCKLMQQICSTREVGWLLLSWANCEFLFKLQQSGMQFNMLIFFFNVKKRLIISLFIYLFELTYIFLISSVTENGKIPKSRIKLRISAL